MTAITDDVANAMEQRLADKQADAVREIQARGLTGEEAQAAFRQKFIEALASEGLVTMGPIPEMGGQIGYQMTELGFAFGRNRAARGFGQLMHAAPQGHC